MRVAMLVFNISAGADVQPCDQRVHRGMHCSTLSISEDGCVGAGRQTSIDICRSGICRR